MPQSGSDLVSAGYPTANALTALLGGTGNATSPNVPVYSNLYLSGVSGGLTDVVPGTSSVAAVAVPVGPGATITKISLVVGGTSAASANVTNLWAGLYTGSGSAPGTTGAQPTLIAQTASLSATNVPSSSLLTFTFGTPQTITSVQAPYGYVYAAFSITGASPSFISMSASASGMFPWFSTSPYSLFMTSNGGTGSAAPATIGTATRTANPPVVLLY